MEEYTNTEFEEEGKKIFAELIEYDNQINKQRTSILDHIENLKSKEYRLAIENCLIDSESDGELRLLDKSAVKGNYQEEEEWVEFDHIYVDQYIDGGMIGDEFAGDIYIPITKKLYLKSHYSM